MLTAADPTVKTRLLQSYCLSLYGCALWNLSCPAIHSLEVSFNNIHRRIWRLPRNCHTRILYLTARLYSLFNMVLSRSSSLLSSALSCSSLVVRTVFKDTSILAYTNTGYTFLFGHEHVKSYDPHDGICASVIRYHRLHGSLSDPDTEDLCNFN